MLFLAYSNFWLRIKTEYVTRSRFKKFKETYQETNQIIVCEDGIELSYKTHKITIYWKSLQHLLESHDIFLLSIKLYDYVIVPKRVFSNHEEIKRFREIITAKTGQQIISM